MLTTIWTRIKLIVMEVLNITTNILTPIMGAVCLIMELLCLPSAAIAVAKKIEYYLFQFGATKDIIESAIDKVDTMLGIAAAKDAIEEALTDVDLEGLKDEIAGLLDSVETEVDLEEAKEAIEEALKDVTEDDVKDAISGILGNITLEV